MDKDNDSIQAKALAPNRGVLEAGAGIRKDALFLTDPNSQCLLPHVPASVIARETRGLFFFFTS